MCRWESEDSSVGIKIYRDNRPGAVLGNTFEKDISSPIPQCPKSLQKSDFTHSIHPAAPRFRRLQHEFPASKPHPQTWNRNRLEMEFVEI